MRNPLPEYVYREGLHMILIVMLRELAVPMICQISTSLFIQLNDFCNYVCIEMI